MGDDERDRGFDALFTDSFRTVVRTVWFVVGDWEDARELAQDSFAAAFVHWRKVSTYENPGAWVRRVAIRKAVRARGRSRRRDAVGIATVPDANQTDVGLDVRVAILRLPTQQRAAVVLHYLHDLPVAAVARELGCSEGTVKTHLSRARQTLAGLLREEHDDDDR
jgi:RNA polymerase sigma-70 factor (ECF subfamily)